MSGGQSARLVVNGTGSDPADTRFNSYFTVHKDDTIVLRFEVRINDSSFFNFEVCRNYPPYTSLYRSTDHQSGIPIGSEKSIFEYEMAPLESDANFRLGYLLGNLDTGDTIWLDNVEIREKTTVWDGNIIPNPEFDEYRDPDFPSYRKKRLYRGTSPNDEGGWEGGFCYDTPTDMVFDIDTTEKLSGKNSAHIIINSKSGTDFFNGAYTVFFQANGGKAYEFSFDALATGNVLLSVAMNRQPFSKLESEDWNVGAPYYAYTPDRFFEDIVLTTERKTFTVQTREITLSQGMYQVFFANFPAGPAGGNWRRSVCVDRLHYNEDGSMQEIVQTAEGVPEIPLGSGDRISLRGKDLQVYPNPLQGNFLRVGLPPEYAGRQASISILTTDGRVIYREQSNGSTDLILEPGLAPGTYIILSRSGELFNSSLLLVSGRE